MPQNIIITITNSGPDIGPYNIYYVDDIGNITNGPTNIPKSTLISGYPLVIADNIVTVRIQSVNADCATYHLDLNVPPSTTTTTTTIAPTCVCYYVEAPEGSVVTWTDCYFAEQTNFFTGAAPGYCAQIGTLSVDNIYAVIQGGLSACTFNDCPIPPPCKCLTITNLNATSTTVSYLDCSGLFQSNIFLGASSNIKVCGSLASSPGNITVATGSDCVIDGDGFLCADSNCSTCNCITFTNSGLGGDIVAFYNCDGVYTTHIMGDYEVYQICGSKPTSPVEKITIVTGATCSPALMGGCGCSPTTTSTSTTSSTTTTTTIPPSCNCYSVTNISGTYINVNFVNCNGIASSIPIDFPGSAVFCARSVPVSSAYSQVNTGLCIYGSLCNPTTTSTTSTTTVAPSTTTSTTTLITRCYRLANSLISSMTITYYDEFGILHTRILPPSSGLNYQCASSVVPQSGLLIANIGDCSNVNCTSGTTSTSTTSTSTSTTTSTSTSTTSTTTFPPLTICRNYTIGFDTPGIITYWYIDCNGDEQLFTITSGTATFCAQVGTVDYTGPAYVFIGSVCSAPATTTSSTTTLAPGSILFTNHSSTGTSVLGTTPAFYVITDGAFPLPSGTAVAGTHAGFSGIIGVHTSPGASGCLTLTINGILVQTIPITPTWSYFSSIVIPSSASILIDVLSSPC
jgi:hypothetical protein